MKTSIRIATFLILAVMALPGKAQISINLCAGNSTVITAVNSLSLSGPSYSMNPGGITSTSPAFTIAPASNVTYTLYVTGTNSNSAVVTTSNTVTVGISSGVIYSVTSPSNSFTLGCGSMSLCPIVVNASTTPVNGGVVTFTLLAPGSSTVLSGGVWPYTGSVGTANAPGTWSVVVRDPNSLCTYWSTVNVIANTAPPVIGSISGLQNQITCNNANVILSVGLNPNIQYNWNAPTGIPGFTTSTANNSLVINPALSTQSIAATATLVATDLITYCVSSTVVTVYQNLYEPNALINGPAPAGACQSSVVLVNGSTTGIPPGTFTSTAPVTAFLWQGPSPQPTLGISSGYTAQTIGIYTMTVVDGNNGCTKTATYAITALAPGAAFVHTVTSGVTVFNDASTGTGNSTAYYWDFGDGITSTLQNPTHTYISAGAHLVKFKVTNSGSCADSVIQSVTISGIPCVANSGFSMVPTATAQVWNVIPNYPWNISAASWDWGDGTSSNTLYTSHQYAVAGLYNICLSVTVSCVASSSSCTTYSVYRISQAALILQINVTAPELTTGIATAEADGQFSWNIVPNPNTGEFNLNMNTDKSEPVRIVISDLTGRIVHEQALELNGTSISVQTYNLSPGMYLVSLETASAKLTKRMIVSH